MKQRLEQYDGVIAKWADPHARGRALRLADVNGSKLLDKPDDPQRSAWIETLLARRRAEREGSARPSK